MLLVSFDFEPRLHHCVGTGCNSIATTLIAVADVFIYGERKRTSKHVKTFLRLASRPKVTLTRVGATTWWPTANQRRRRPATPLLCQAGSARLGSVGPAVLPLILAAPTVEWLRPWAPYPRHAGSTPGTSHLEELGPTRLGRPCRGCLTPRHVKEPLAPVAGAHYPGFWSYLMMSFFKCALLILTSLSHKYGNSLVLFHDSK